MEIKLASTQKEIDEAADLSCKSFPLSYFEAREARRVMCQFLPDDFKKNNFIVAVDKKKVVAVLRYFSRKMKMLDVEFDVIGLTDYCVDKDNVDDPIFGFKFLGACYGILKKTAYPLALGSARRVMANYYYGFGHIGSDCYCKCRIEKLSLPEVFEKKVKFIENFKEANIAAYEKKRRNAFSSDWAMVKRGEDFWRWIGYNSTGSAHKKKYRFFEMIERSKLVGFVIISANSCVDYGIGNKNFEMYTRALIKFLAETIPLDRLVLHFSPTNRIFKTLGLSNISYMMRYVPDEGVLALGLNKDALVRLFCRILENARRRFEYSWKDLTLSDVLSFRWTGEKVIPGFQSGQMKRRDEQILANCLFSGTVGPFSLLNYDGPIAIPPTFFRINDLDAM